MTLDAITRSRAAERQAVADLLRAATPGETVTLAALSAAAGTDIQRARHILRAASEMVREEDGMVFEAIPNVGVRRMTAPEVAKVIPDKRRRKAHRQTIKGLRELATVDPATLPPGERTLHQAGMSLLGAMAAFSTSAASRVVRRSVESRNGELPVAETLEALKAIPQTTTK